MPLHRVSGADAIHNLRTNLYGSWPSRQEPDANRVEPICRPAFFPSFKLEYGEKVFTIGSCFARNIEMALMARGFDVVTSRLSWPDSAIEGHGNEVLNNYSVASIAQELRWALDPSHPFDAKAVILELTPTRFVDPNLHGIRPAPLEKVLSYRAAITEVTKRVVDCRVVVMTLGLSEAWYDTVTGNYLNAAPPRSLTAKCPDRFEVHVLDFTETVQALRESIALLGQHCRSDQRILLTVSPVPLNRTFTARDIIVMNSYSKSVLRTAAEHVAVEYSHIDYFPSYESIMLSDRSVTWMDDQIHVQRPLIEVNVERMIEAYKPDTLPVTVSDVASLLADAEDEIAVKNFDAAIRILEPLSESVHFNVQLATTYADLLLRLNRPRDACTVMAKLQADAVEWRQAFVEARALVLDGRTDEGIAALRKLVEENPKRALILRALAEAYCDIEAWDDALIVAKRWHEVARQARSPEPLFRVAKIHEARGDAASADLAFLAAIDMGTARNGIVFDYVEFLFAQKRFQEAARMLEGVTPESRVMQRRFNELRMFVPAEL